MIKKIAWQTFKNTGDINTFMELKQIEEIEKEIESKKTKKCSFGWYANVLLWRIFGV